MAISFTNNNSFITLDNSGDIILIRKNHVFIYSFEPFLAIQYNDYNNTNIENFWSTHYSAVTSPSVSNATQLQTILQGYIDNNISFTGGTISNVTVTGNSSFYILSATTLYSGSTELSSLFFSNSSLNATQLATKANLSGATFTDQITAPTANTTYLKVNTASANTTNPERVIIYDGVANSFSNVLVGIASASTYAQLNIQNLSAASGSSSDIIATANNGSESTNYVDLGINSSGFNSGNVGAANDGYVYGAANDFYVGNTTRNKKVGIFIGASSATTVDFTSGNTTFNQPVSAVTITASTYYSGTSLLQSYFPYDQSSFRLRGSSSDRWHTFTKFGFSFSSAALTNGRLYAFPLIVGENITIDRLGVSLSSTPTSAGTEVIRLGIYNSLPSTHYPGTLLLDAGTVPASAITNLVSVAINQSLTPGLYYLALQSNNTNTIRTIPTTAIDGTIGFGNNPVLGITSYMYSTNHTSFGVLPNNPFTATTNATITAPAIFYRIN